MAYWLLKQEPDCYPYQKLVADGSTVWDGVSNPLALIHMRTMKPGDKAFYYHTGKDKAIVAICEITSMPVPDPNDEKKVNMTVSPVEQLKHPVTLAAIKADEAFAEWELVKNSRLSVMPVSAVIWKKILAMAKR